MQAYRRLLSLTSLLAWLPAGVTAAADFDGSKSLLCATQQVMDITTPQDVITGLPGELGAPTFMQVDFQKKTITGAKRTTQIRVMEQGEQQILLQGTELGLGWTLAVNGQDGTLVGSLVDDGGAIVMFGACSAL